MGKNTLRVEEWSDPGLDRTAELYRLNREPRRAWQEKLAGPGLAALGHADPTPVGVHSAPPAAAL
ncbi:MAG: hypothetical protein OXN89_10625 [Bryobacterales bacterium]|nr:hypothetical protein [Bryobacterales bacterium]